VIVKGTEYFDGKLSRYVDFPVTDVLQMMGRAGRPQFDTTGVACIFVHEPKKTFYKKFLHEPFPVESSLHEQLHNHINAEVASGGVASVADCVEWLSFTYLFRRLCMNPSYYGVPSKDPTAVRSYLENLIDTTLGDLAQAGCLKLHDDYFLRPSLLGKTASAFYLDYRSVTLIDDRLQRWQTQERVLAGENALVQLVQLIADVQEYSELPVRHNEEDLNAELADALPWDTAGDMESPHTKAFLLLQAHFYCQPLPISDYVNDTKSVLDQLPRIVGATMELAAARGMHGWVERCTLVLQMSLQACPADASSLSQVPNLSLEHIKTLQRRGIVDLTALAAIGSEGPTHVRQVIKIRSEDKWRDMWAFLREVPDFTMSARVTARAAVGGEALVEATREQEGVDLILSLNQTRGRPGSKIRCPKAFKKVQSLSYFVLVRDEGDRGALVGFRSLGDLKSTNTSVTIPLSTSVLGKVRIVIQLVPQCLLGIQWTHTTVVEL